MVNMFNNLFPSKSKVFLIPLRKDNSLDLIFLKENRGKFKYSDKDSKTNQDKYVERLTKFATTTMGCSIMVAGVEVGFIICGGKNNSLIGGVYPEFQGKGYYREARNAFIKKLNDYGIYDVTYTIDAGNKRMLEINKSFLKTKYREDLYIAHYDPTVQCANVHLSVRLGRGGKSSVGELYHLSFNKNLATLHPRIPEGDVNGGVFKEPNIPRVSLSPSPELCFRAIYANIRTLLEGVDEPTITLTLYRAKRYRVKDLNLPAALIRQSYVHDAHVTLEHFVTSDVELEKVGLVNFKNTSNGKDLNYRPFLAGEVRPHSPRDIEVVK